MLALLRMEFYKIWHRSTFCIFLLFLFLFHGGFLLYTQSVTATLPAQSYQKLQTVLDTLPNEERYAYLCDYQKEVEAFITIEQLTNMKDSEQKTFIKNQHPDLDQYLEAYQKRSLRFTNSWEQEALFLKEIQKEFDVIHQYPSYLQTIQEKAQVLTSVSIFQGNDQFANENIKKTAADFSHLQQVSLSYESEKGVKEALTSPITNFVLFLIVFALATSLINEERDKELLGLIRMTPHGQHKTIAVKMISLCVSIFFISTVFLMSNLLMMMSLTSLGDLQRPLQSLASFTQCTLSISLFQFILIFIVHKGVALGTLGLLVMLSTLLCKRKSFAILCPCFLLLMGFCFYTFIDANASLSVLKYCNLYTLFQTNELYQTYLNFRMFHTPIDYRNLMYLFLIVCNVLCFFFVDVAFRKANLQTINTPLLKRFPFSKHISLSIWKQECYKLIKLQKAGMICLCFLAFQVYQYQHQRFYLQQEDRFYMQYMTVLEGYLDEDKETFLKNEQQRFQTIHDQIDHAQQDYANHQLTKRQYDVVVAGYDQQLANEEVFQSILQQSEDIKKGTNRAFVLPTGYRLMLQNPQYTILPAILALLFSFLAFGNLFSFEYQRDMNTLTSLTFKRNHRNYRKFLLLFVGCLGCYVLAYAPPIIHIIQTYGLPVVHASITSLKEYEGIGWDSSIGLVLFFTHCIRFLAVYIACVLLSAIATSTKRQLLALFWGFLLLILPLLLSYSGISVLDHISLSSLCTAYSTPQIETTLGLLIAYLGIAGVSGYIIIKHH